MIFYIARKHHTLGIQLHYFPGKLAEIVRLLPYEALYANGELPAGSYIFTDHDRLSRAQNEKVCHLWDWLDATNSEIRRLNDPRRVLLRFDLLRRLHEVGINDFNVYRLNEWRRVSRFPVFIRRERGHQKPLTGLLNGRLALSEAVNRFGNATDKADLMIVEFGNEPFADGRYRKYGAFRVGDRYYVQHCFITKDWYGKFNEDILEADVLESREYSRRNPHASQLREIFEIAGIEYGRIDYGIMGNRIQVFEINTNPSILAMESVQRPNPLINSVVFRENSRGSNVAPCGCHRIRLSAASRTSRPKEIRHIDG